MRRQDWEGRLLDTIARHEKIPFEWGKTDCLCFIIDCVDAVLQELPCPDIRGTYDSKAGALKEMLRNGARTVEDSIAAYFPPVAVPMAQRGDIGLVDMPGDTQSGVILFGAMGIGRTEKGIVHFPRNVIRRAFKVA